MTFEDQLASVGDNGRFQVLAFCFFGVCFSFIGGLGMTNVFITAKRPFWCSNANATSALTNGNSTLARPTCVYDSGGPYSNQTQLRCSEWSFSTEFHASTIQSHYGLVCDMAFAVPLCQTMYMAGFLVGSSAGGILSDKRGRRFAFSVFVLVAAGVGSATPFAPFWQLYITGRCVLGATAGALTTITYTYLSELVSTRYRINYMILLSVWWMLGYTLVAVVAYLVRRHEYLEIAIAAPMLLLASILLLLPESPRWLFAANATSDGVAALQRIGEWNHKPSTAIELETRHLSASDASRRKKRKSDIDTTSVVDLFRHRGIVRVTLVLWYAFFVASFAYYGLFFASSDFTANIYMYTVVGGLIEMAAISASSLVGHRVGRVFLLMLSAAAGGVCCLVCMALIGRSEPAAFAGLTVMTLVGRTIIDVFFCTVWPYGTEVYPTPLRSTGVGSASTIARVAGILAPQVQLLARVWQPLPFLVYGLLVLVAALTALLLPETRRQVPPDTLAEAEIKYKQMYIGRLLLRFRRRSAVPS